MPYTPNNPLVPGDPYSYDLNWIIKQIKSWAGKYDSVESAILALQTDFEDLKNYVDNFIDNLDLQTAVNAKIDELVANGTIANILSTLLYQKKAAIIRVGRFLDAYVKNNTSRILANQSCCFNNNLYYSCGNLAADDSSQSVTVWNSVGTLINSNTFTELGHANDIAYLSGKLYIATGSQIAIVDASTLTFEGYISTSFATCRAVASDDEKIYIIGTIGGSVYGIESYDPVTTEQVVLFSNLINAGSVPQGCCYHDGYIYHMFNRGNVLQKINISSGITEQIYNIPSNDGYFWTGEMEAPLIVNGNLCIYAAFGTAYDAMTCSIGQIFQSDIISQLSIENYGDYMINVNPVSITINGSATPQFNPVTEFTVADEANIIVPATIIRLSNVTSGYIEECRGKVCTLIRTSGTITLSCVRAYGSYLKTDLVSITSLITEGSEVDIFFGTIDTMSCRFSHVTARNATINTITNLERTILELNATSVTAATTGSLSSAVVKYDAGVPAITDSAMIAAFNTIKNALATVAATKYLTVEIGVIASNVYYTFGARVQYSAYSPGLTLTNDTAVLTFDSTNGLRLTVGGVATAINQIIAVRSIC